MKLHHSFGVFIAWVLLTGLALGQTPVSVPTSKRPVMIDGKVGAGEWEDAAKVSLGSLGQIYLKQTKEHLWFALELPQGQSGTLDLYLAPGDGQLVNMHASAKLGQRLLQKGSWPEEWKWWNNEGWVANISRVDSWEKRTFLPETVREYQISKSWLPKKDLRMMLEIMTKAEPNWVTTPFPAGAVNTDPKAWMVFRLE